MTSDVQEASRADRALTWAAALLAVAWLAWVQLSFNGLYDLDSYFHVRAAEQLAVHGVEKTFPQATQSTWTDRYSDKDFLFHVLLVPFVGGDPFAGGKWAVIALDALVLASFALAIRAFGIRFGALWVLLLVATSPYYVTRLASVRPHILGLAFVTLEIALLFRDRWKTLLVVAFLHVLAHSSFLLLPALLVARIATSLLRREPFPRALAAAAVGGIVAASVLHPYFPNNLTLADQIVDIVRSVSANRTEIPREAFGSELGPITWQSFLAQAPGWLPGLVGLVLVLGVYGVRGWPAGDLYLTLVAGGLLIVAVRSRRFVDVFVVAALLLAGALWTRLAGGRTLAALLRTRALVFAPCALAMLVLVGWAGSRVADMRDRFQRQAMGDVFAPAVAAVGRLAAPEDVVYHNSWMDFAVLYAFRPDGRYISGLDPIFLYQHDPGLFAKNLALSRGQGKAPEIVARDFGARWIWVTTQPRDQAFRKLLERSPGVRPVYADQAAQVWQVLEPLPPATR